MSRLRVYARIARVLLVVGLGLSMATVFGVFERLGMAHSMERRQRWSRFFMARLSNALPFDVTVQGELPKTSMLWVSNHVSWTDIPLLGMLTPSDWRVVRGNDARAELLDAAEEGFARGGLQEAWRTVQLLLKALRL